MGTSKPTITIIGTGALGSTLHKFFRKDGFFIRSTWNSRGGLVYSEESGEFHQVQSLLPGDDSETGDWLFITTPDDLISKTAEHLSDKTISWEGKTVVHCSGNLTSDELNALSEKGAKIASMHPLQTFKKGDDSKRFKNITISLQGDSHVRDLLKPVIKKMGANWIILDKKQKRILHITGVMASNYLVALMFSVENLLKDAELDEGFGTLESLVNQTVTNIFEKGPANVLTGPIARGDAESVRTHLTELEGREQEDLYKNLGLEAVKIAERGGNVSQDKIRMLRELLQDTFTS